MKDVIDFQLDNFYLFTNFLRLSRDFNFSLRHFKGNRSKFWPLGFENLKNKKIKARRKGF